MTLSGIEIHQALLSVRRLHGQVALLLRTTDAQLIGEHDFQSWTNSTCKDYGSALVESPDEWMPSTVFRFYKLPSGTKDIAAFVSVIICPRYPERHAVAYKEPLVSAGWVQLAAPVDTWDASRYFWASMITEADVARDGRPFRWRQEAPDAKGAVERLCFAVPLVEITSTEQLIARIVDPLRSSLGLAE